MLESIFQELNQAHFAGELPPPKLKWNPRLSSTAGRFCPGSRNFLRPRTAEIEVATYLRDLPDGTMHVRDTILHEMIHYYLWHRNRPHGHTAEFHRIMKKLGAKRYNTVPKERAWLHWYECPHCLKGFPTRRRLGISACARCCEMHTGGRYHERFRLQRKAYEEKPAAAPKPLTEVTACEPATPRLTPAEIIRRLEDLKALVRPR